MTDIRLDAINLLTAILEHDRFTSLPERTNIEATITILDRLMDREASEMCGL